MEQLNGLFESGKYEDVAGLCRVATREVIESQSWSLSPGRYVGVAEHAEDGFIFGISIMELNEELEILNSEAHEIEEQISRNMLGILEKID
ncbi:unnamed protein product [marine sediment metagenome]|uniref:DNA methylase adenine-specific domain-containing protein n=1 Tax=marine sediment metagenome TaxID=412755 RepID=X1BXK4_9ZZZZ